MNSVPSKWRRGRQAGAGSPASVSQDASLPSTICLCLDTAFACLSLLPMASFGCSRAVLHQCLPHVSFYHFACLLFPFYTCWEATFSSWEKEGGKKAGACVALLPAPHTPLPTIKRKGLSSRSCTCRLTGNWVSRHTLAPFALYPATLPFPFFFPLLVFLPLTLPPSFPSLVCLCLYFPLPPSLLPSLLPSYLLTFFPSLFPFAFPSLPLPLPLPAFLPLPLFLLLTGNRCVVRRSTFVTRYNGGSLNWN